MRFTVNLDSDLYAVAKSLARAEDCSLSAAVNRLLRRSLAHGARRGPSGTPERRTRNGLPISRGAMPLTADMVRHEEESA